jgi:hypothetical protein
MHELALITVFTGALLGSTHCVVMCGGIATALGATRMGTTSIAGSRAGALLLYQFGRISGYAIAGSLAGAFGVAAGLGFRLSRWSEILRLATAVVVVLMGLDIALGNGTRARWLRAPERVGALLWRRIAPLASRSLPAAGAARALLLGLLWGWLPCGLVYSALLAAALAGSAAGGGALMIAFGLGTLPAMLGFSYAGARLPRAGTPFARMLGAVIVACGVWTAALPIAILTDPAHHDHRAMSMPSMPAH